MSHIIDTETIPTDAGKYSVQFIYDESADQPEDEGFVLAVDNRWRNSEVTHGDYDAEAFAAVQGHVSNADFAWGHELRSGAAIVRYLRLKGNKGVTLVTQNFYADEPSTDRHQPVYGFAVAPDDASDPDAYVKSSLESWRAWANGDVFGYRVLDPQGNEVEDGSVWGYYGFSREYDYVLSEAKAAAEYDAKERVAQANTVGAGFVGVI